MDNGRCLLMLKRLSSHQRKLHFPYNPKICINCSFVRLIQILGKKTSKKTKTNEPKSQVIGRGGNTLRIDATNSFGDIKYIASKLFMGLALYLISFISSLKV